MRRAVISLVTTLAQPAHSARRPCSDGAGNIYVGDGLNHRIVVVRPVYAAEGTCAIN